MSYIEELEKKLTAAKARVKSGREAKILKDSAPTLFEIIDGEISLAVNRMTQDKPLDYEGYLSAHGEVKGIRRIRDLLNSKAAEEVSAAQEVTIIQDNLTQLKDDQKQK